MLSFVSNDCPRLHLCRQSTRFFTLTGMSGSILLSYIESPRVSASNKHLALSYINSIPVRFCTFHPIWSYLLLSFSINTWGTPWQGRVLSFVAITSTSLPSQIFLWLIYPSLLIKSTRSQSKTVLISTLTFNRPSFCFWRMTTGFVIFQVYL